MGLLDGIARRFGYTHAEEIRKQIEDEIAKRPQATQFGTGFVTHDPVKANELNFSPPIVTGLGRNKAVLTEFWINPLYGQPRLVDLQTVKRLARHGIATMCIEKIIDIITQQGWAIMPKKGKKMNQAHHDAIVEFLHHPNRNNETFESILRKIIRGILESDDGTIVKVYDEYEERSVYNFVDSGRNQPALPTQNANTSNPLGSDKFPTENAQLIEIFAEDGSSFLKGVDMHGYLYRYFQYSFIIPRKPIMFDPKELCYISANARAGSCYGYSPFESIVDWLSFLIKSGKYSERFFTNSSYPAFQLDLPNVKTQAEMEAWAEWMRKNYMGEEKAFQALITNQNAKVTPLMFDHRALQNLESQQWYFSLICAKLKVPQSLLGFTQSVNRSTAGQQSATFISQGVKPLERIIEHQFNKDVIELLDPDGCCEWVFIEESDLNEEVTRANIRATYIQNSIKTPNEIRTELNLDPIEGGDETMAQRTERTQQEATQRQHEQNMQMESTKKPAPSKSPAFQGSEPTTGKAYTSSSIYVVKAPKSEETYIGICVNDAEDVYTHNLLKHKEHQVMRNNKIVDLKKLLT